RRLARHAAGPRQRRLSLQHLVQPHRRRRRCRFRYLPVQDLDRAGQSHVRHHPPRLRRHPARAGRRRRRLPGLPERRRPRDRATRVNGITDYFLTKLDVLSGLDTVPICVGYEVDGVRIDEMPMTQTDVHHAKPIYEEMPGWWEDITHARTFEELPKTAQNYVL